jgi:hypothetical protein
MNPESRGEIGLARTCSVDFGHECCKRYLALGSDGQKVIMKGLFE